MASVAVPLEGAAAKQPSVWGSIGFVFAVAIVYLVVLLAAGFVYVTPLASQLGIKVPNSIGPIAVGVPWFGALGAVLTSLSGVFDHRHDWDVDMRYWHFSRPLIGATLGIVAVLIFQAGVVVVNTQATSPSATGTGNILYYLIAFLIGYREETFRELIKRLGDVILSPGDGGPGPIIRVVSPDAGPSGGGTPVTISGANLKGTTDVHFGQARASAFRVDSDGQITATSPRATAAGPVLVSVTTKQGSATGGTFTYRDPG